MNPNIVMTPQLIKLAQMRMLENRASKGPWAKIAGHARTVLAVEKRAFTPMDANGPMPPPGGLPQGQPGAGGPPPGDPLQQDGPSPGADPGGGAGGPPQAVTVQLQDLMQLFQQVAGGGAGGAPNEPGKAKGAGKDQILTEIKASVDELKNQYHQLFAFLTGAQMQQSGQPPDGASNAPAGMGGGVDPSQMGAAMQPGDPSQGQPPPEQAPPPMQQQASLRGTKPPFLSKEAADQRYRGQAMSNILTRLKK